mgnify:CR=1 FL=1
MEFFNRLMQQLRAFWTRLNRKQQTALAGSTVVILAGLFALVVWANRVDYQPLFTNLKPEQVPPIVEALKQRKESYQLLDGGTGVAVPASRVLELRMAMATDGALKDGTVGFELFDHSSLGVTNFVERLNYQRALQGELVRTINELDQVEASRVHLVLPKDSLFVQDQRPATASVVLKLKAGARLDRAQIQGITHLVAAGIEGLDPSNVSIVDTEGRVLASPREDSASAVPGTLLEHQETLEKKTEDRIQMFLERVVGPGKVIAKVQAALDSSSSETTAETFNPDGRVPRSEQSRSELRSNASDEARGVPGTGSNLPENAAVNATSSQGTSIDKKESTINYEIDKTVSRTVQAPGQLKRLSVAVLIDGTYAAAKGAEGAAAEAFQYTARTEQEMKLFEQIVKNAVGFSVERGDQVSVTNLPFQKLEQDLVAEASAIPWERPVQYAMVLVGMILIFMLMRPLLRTLVDVPAPVEDAAATEAALLAASAEAGALPPGLSQKLLTAGSQDRQKRDEMVNLVQSDIENTVATVREWLR